MSFRRVFSISTVKLFYGKPNANQCLSRFSTGTVICTEFKNSETTVSCWSKPLRIKTNHHINHNHNIAPFKYDAYTFLRIPALYVSHERTVQYGTRFFGTSGDSVENNATKETPPKKLTLLQKFKAMYRDYWYVLVPVHLLTSAVWFGSFYYMARTGVDIAALAEMAHLSEELIEKIRKSSNSLAGHLAISYLLYKVFTPLRYTVTLVSYNFLFLSSVDHIPIDHFERLGYLDLGDPETCISVEARRQKCLPLQFFHFIYSGTTISINYLKRWGWIKPMPKREELKKMFDDKKVELKRKRDSFKERHELMKRSVNKMKLTSKKRIKKTSDMVDRMLQRRRNNRKE